MQRYAFLQRKCLGRTNMLKVLFTYEERKEINRRPESQDSLCQPPGGCLNGGKADDLDGPSKKKGRIVDLIEELA